MISAGSFWPVAVHGGDDGRGGRPHAATQRRTLAGAPVAEITQHRVAAEQRLDLGIRPIVARVIDNDHLLQRPRRHRGNRLLDEGPDIAGLVIGGDDDSDAHRQISQKAPEGKGAPSIDQ
jgi:hypothetical protein